MAVETEASPIAARGVGQERRLFLIDGPSLVYRAFFALPESIATSAGVPTNAIFGFASMLVKIISEYGLHPTIVAWDAGNSGRNDLYSDYKANRRSRPDLLREQWPAMEPLVEAFGYRNYRIEGYEADDVIASLAERARTADPPIPVMVVTGDRDAFQLIDEPGLVKVMATSRGITETKIYDRPAVIERYGVAPEEIPDFYGLKGDTSDNIPGVPGIGDKTASELIQRFGSLEGVLAHIDEISGAKRKQNLTEHAEAARISKQLATIHRDLALDFDPHAEASHEPDRSRLREVFREYELRDPLRRLEEALALPELDAAVPAGAAEVVLKAATIHTLYTQPGEGDQRILREVGSFAAGFDAVSVAVLSVEVPDGALFAEGPAWRFAVAGGREQPRLLVGDCEDPGEVVSALRGRPAVAHDAKALGLVPAPLAHDTMIGAYLLEPARRGYPLEELCEERGLGSDVEDPAGAQALLIGELAARQREEIAEQELEGLLRDIELPLVSVLRDMELAGVRLNVPGLEAITARVREEITALEREIFELAEEEFLISSPQQLGEVLFTKLGLSRRRRGKTGFSTDARVLQAIREEHAIVPLIERWRELSTLAKTYLDVLPELVDAESRIHTTFLQTVAQTGRLSSTNPNLQNVPIRTSLGREIRGCFDARPGDVLISADYSQIELRILAHVADEPVLKEIFRRSEDVHTGTASAVFQVEPSEIDPGMRSKAKMINYGIVYGLSDFGLADRLNIPREEAKAIIDAYLERFPRVAAFISETIGRATAEGYVATLWGRRRLIPELRDRNYQVRSLGERLAVNTVIQGSAADIIKLAMVRCHGELAQADVKTRLILTIHDELLFEGPPEEVQSARELIERGMVGVWPHDPPLSVDIGVGENWLRAK